MQLIIIPRRDMWKPGTEGIGKDERRVEGIPLNKEYIQYAYAFLNIERKQGQFLTKVRRVYQKQEMTDDLVIKSADDETEYTSYEDCGGVPP